MVSLLFMFCLSFLSVSGEWVKDMENPGLYEGDIVLDPDEKEASFGKWNGYASIKGGRWPNAEIDYVIESSIGERGRNAIKAAIADYEKDTCLRFFKKRRHGIAHISFYRGGGCSSLVGYRSGRMNRISLASGCQTKGVTMHEIGHSIGLYHEQSRPDRDQYVRIIWNNIQSSMQFNFNKQSTRNINSLGTRYDYRSMMHYGSTAFGGGRRTIETINSANQRLIGNRHGFSEIDKKQINLMYCKGRVTPTTPTRGPTTDTPTGVTTGPTDTPTGVTTGPTDTPPTHPTPSTGGCLRNDLDKRCVYWAQRGYCAQSNAIEKNYVEIMKRKCCRACKGHAKCADYNSRCSEWKNRGECRRNPNYMHRYCRKACRRCS